jgi:tetratricopeptide (TPR) repeat protein
VLRAMGFVAAPVLVDALISRESVMNIVNIKDPAASVKPLREALEVATRDIGIADERTLKAATALAFMLGPGVMEKKEEAAAAIEPVYRAVRAAGKLPPSNPTLLAAQSLYGQILCTLGRGDEGIPLLEQVLSEAVAMHREGKELRGALLGLARGQTGVGRLNDSIATYASTYALLADREPFASRLRSTYGGDLAYALLRARKPLEAEAFVEEQQSYRNSLTASDTATAAELDFQIAFKRLWIKLQVGEFESARQVGEAMLRRYREEKSPYYAYVTNIFMPDIYLAAGHPAEAEKAAEAELQYAVERGNASPMEYGSVARTKFALGQAAEALALTENHEGKPDPSDAVNVDLANMRLARGRALHALGRAADARKPLAGAYEFWRAFAPNDHFAAVAAYWYAQSLFANGEVEAAQRLHASATPPRDYPTADLAVLRAERLRSPQQRIGAVLLKYPLRPEVAALISKRTSR